MAVVAWVVGSGRVWVRQLSGGAFGRPPAARHGPALIDRAAGQQRTPGGNRFASLVRPKCRPD